MGRLISIFLALGISGCASSSPYMLPESDTLSRAPGAAFAGAAMFTRKPMPDRRDIPEYEFYYKHCSMSGEETYFSKTSYDCTSGPFP